LVPFASWIAMELGNLEQSLSFPGYQPRKVSLFHRCSGVCVSVKVGVE